MPSYKDSCANHRASVRHLNGTLAFLVYERSDDDDDDDDDINLRPGGASETDIPRPPKGYRDVLS
jgi:nitrate reductase NapAB chaperone NapD